MAGNETESEVSGMPRGKITPPEEIYRIMASWAITNNVNETANQLNIAESTVRKIVKENKNKPEFTKLCEEKREEFSKIADRIIRKATKRLERELDDENKDIPVNHLTTVIGTMYDKKALADGNPTERTEIIGSAKLNKLAELAGYERKQ